MLMDILVQLGLWVISTAKLWPEATFVSICSPMWPEVYSFASQVGLDMVNIQIPLQVLEQDIAERIEWVHTNM